MKSTIVIAAILVACLAQAKEPKHYQNGTLLQMDSAECGFDENSGKSLVGELVGTDSAHKKTHAMLCQEYLLQSDKVIYRIRPKDEKHPVLLPVGERAQFRIHKDKMLLRAEDLDDKGTRISRGFDDPTAEQGVRRKHLTQIGLGLKTRPRSRILCNHLPLAHPSASGEFNQRFISFAAHFIFSAALSS